MKIRNITIKQKLYYLFVILCTISISCFSKGNKTINNNKPRVIVTSDGEIDDECSMFTFPAIRQSMGY